jgi:hypothetical protein
MTLTFSAAAPLAEGCSSERVLPRLVEFGRPTSLRAVDLIRAFFEQDNALSAKDETPPVVKPRPRIL